jgi:hypothetical protein
MKPDLAKGQPAKLRILLCFGNLQEHIFLNMATFAHFFQKPTPNTLHWIFFCCCGVKIPPAPPQKKTLLQT